MNNANRKRENRHQLVTFMLGPEVYGIDIFKVQEVIHYQDVTRIPQAPEFVEGVIKVRDQVIPVIDLGKRLHIRERSEGKKRIMILELGERYLGVIVDDISQVLLLDDASLEGLPDAVVDSKGGSCITSLAKTDEGMVILISPDLILNGKEKKALEEMESAQEM